jgi:hypothetical protein
LTARAAAVTADPAGPGAQALQTLVASLDALLGTAPPVTPDPTPTPEPTPTPDPTSTPDPVGPVTPAAAPIPVDPVVSPAFRVSIVSVKAAKNRKSVKVRIACPATAPEGCTVTLKGAVAGRSAFRSKVLLVPRGTSKVFTVNLTAATANRLKRKGGSLKLSAATPSSPPAATTVKVARVKR